MEDDSESDESIDDSNVVTESQKLIDTTETPGGDFFDSKNSVESESGDQSDNLDNFMAKKSMV